MTHRRAYKSGTSWCLWRWTEVESDYIVRLHLIKTPWFAICLHWIQGIDREPWYHDHPVSFLSLILRGWYQEYRQIDGVPYIMVHKWWNYIKASPDDRHAISAISYSDPVTLCFMGSKTREWGFHTDKGWVYWKDYYAAKRVRQYTAPTSGLTS